MILVRSNGFLGHTAIGTGDFLGCLLIPPGRSNYGRSNKPIQCYQPTFMKGGTINGILNETMTGGTFIAGSTRVQMNNKSGSTMIIIPYLSENLNHAKKGWQSHAAYPVGYDWIMTDEIYSWQKRTPPDVNCDLIGYGVLNNIPYYKPFCIWLYFISLILILLARSIRSKETNKRPIDALGLATRVFWEKLKWNKL
ncbi:13196_t:CDS:2 [Dentiscutata erythropus]|uniref:13196_t:CDS:1 n=1 Tax=Dentiscutata erythropus TaxID=1348616 RepID=A0A9N9HV70_9GLOM|nr:13196_t:CDS:2 [Dentiscutata erythropus]